MRHLARSHEITYLAFAEREQLTADGRPAPAIEEGMREVCVDLLVVPQEIRAKRSLAFYAEAGVRLFDRLPYAVAKYRSRRFRAHIERLLRTRRFDLIVCDFLFPAVNLPASLPCPAVLFTHNVEADIWRRHTETRTNVISRRLFKMQHERMLRFERECLRRFDGVIAVSDADRAAFAALYPGAIRQRVHVVPTGVDTTYFQPSAARPRAGSLVFTGSMDWLPNEDAMLYFCREVLPIIRAGHPDATLTIVGRAPTPAVERLGSLPGITVTGRVDDVRPFVQDAAVFVVPLRIGGGTRLKIFEAMAMGKAVVSTTVGAEGLPVTAGEHVAIADDPQEFAAATVRLLRDDQERMRLEAAARQLVASRYEWSAVAGALEEALVRFSSPAAPDTSSVIAAVTPAETN
jgi:sugar transferase (PEP-CTERM/EpsH1 system associated)